MSPRSKSSRVMRCSPSLRRLGRGRSTKSTGDPRIALLTETTHQRAALRRYRTWLRARG